MWSVNTPFSPKHYLQVVNTWRSAVHIILGIRRTVVGWSFERLPYGLLSFARRSWCDVDMNRLVDYFLVVGYDHNCDREYSPYRSNYFSYGLSDLRHIPMSWFMSQDVSFLKFFWNNCLILELGWSFRCISSCRICAESWQDTSTLSRERLDRCTLQWGCCFGKRINEWPLGQERQFVIYFFFFFFYESDLLNNPLTFSEDPYSRIIIFSV